MFKFNNGDRVRDKVSGFVGIVTGRTDYLNGCIRYGVSAEKLKDGAVASSEWFDEQQLELKKARALKVQALRTGGPREAPKGLANPK